ncbi:MAG TPA: CsbD family protein [Thermoanaerobaculia bacterium]|nr:CsbD family protein [Thermoanaerobaculia bacterium]
MWDQVKGNWHQFKGSIREKWNDLTDDDINQMDGKREQIVGKIQERYGEQKWKAADIERELRGMSR